MVLPFCGTFTPSYFGVDGQLIRRMTTVSPHPQAKHTFDCLHPACGGAGMR
jgi:hypothetical protein